MRLFLLLGIVLLLAGCAGTTPDAAPAEPPPASPPPGITCAEHCPSLPHIQCVGAWNISGTYPDCICSFECEVNETTGTSNTTNATSPPPANASPPLPPPPPQNQTGKSAGQLLNEGLASQSSQFYSSHSGTFQENKYTWTLLPPGSTPPILTGLPSEIQFDGAVISSLQASGFYVFTDTAQDTKEIYGIAIFKAASTPLDAYGMTDVFGIDYYSPAIAKELRSCEVYGRDSDTGSDGAELTTYFFRCGQVYDK